MTRWKFNISTQELFLWASRSLLDKYGSLLGTWNRFKYFRWIPSNLTLHKTHLLLVYRVSRVGHTGMKSSAKKRPSFVRQILSRRQRGRFVCPAVNPRIKELIPFGQPKGCERFRVRIISRPGRRRWETGDGESGEKGKESVTGRKARTKDEGWEWPGERRERRKEIARAGGRERECARVCVCEWERERGGREKTRLDVRSAGNKDNSMQ